MKLQYNMGNRFFRQQNFYRLFQKKSWHDAITVSQNECKMIINVKSYNFTERSSDELLCKVADIGRGIRIYAASLAFHHRTAGMLMI